MHLAAASGRPTWHLARTPPDWRWTLDRESSPWYPTMRIFRQNDAGDWDQVLDDVMKALADWTGASVPVTAPPPSRRKAISKA
jgi:hypothetical protein